MSITYLTLHLDNDHYGARIVSMKFSPPSEDFVEQELHNGIWWQISTELPDFTLEHVYQLSNDRTFRRLYYRGGIWCSY